MSFTTEKKKKGGKKYSLLLRKASELVQITPDQKELFKAGHKGMDEISVIKNGSMVVSHSGRILDIGTDEQITLKYPDDREFEKIVDLHGERAVIPGLCDAHTHAVFSGCRIHEFDLKIRGASYIDIHRQGGGISSTVRSVRESSEEELESLLLSRMKRMLSYGTTSVEIKSGYGLDCANELKMLRIIQRTRDRINSAYSSLSQNESRDIVANPIAAAAAANDDDDVSDHPSSVMAMTVISNFCGGHSWMKDEWDHIDDYVRNVIEEQIPKVKKENLASQIDVFHEKGVFDYDASKQILEAGVRAGLQPNFHGDELNDNNSGVLASEIGARAVSHLECINESGIKALSSKRICAVILPTTAYVLDLEQPPVSSMLESGCIIGLGTDFNPNAPFLSVPFAMHLACVSDKCRLRLTMNQSLCAATLNGAYAMGISEDYGSLSIGKFADFVILRRSDWRSLIYDFLDPPIESVWKHGNKVGNITQRGCSKL